MNGHTPGKLHNAIIAALALAPHVVVIGSTATRLHGARPGVNDAKRRPDLDLLWTGASHEMLDAARTTFTPSEWRWKDSPLRGRSLDTPATHERCGIEIMTPDAWDLEHEPGWHRYAGHSLRVAARETLAAMKLALLTTRDMPRDAEALRTLGRLGTNAYDAVRELAANVTREQVRIAYERTRTLYQGLDWQRALARHLHIPCHGDDAEKTWRIHPWYCPQRQREMCVLRESLRFATGTRVDYIVAHYDSFAETLDAARRGDPAHRVRHSPCYDARRAAVEAA